MKILQFPVGTCDLEEELEKKDSNLYLNSTKNWVLPTHCQVPVSVGEERQFI